MPNPNLGTKFTCTSCGTKFYDLRRPQPLCPKCGWNPREAALEAAPVDDTIPFDDDGGMLRLREVYEGDSGEEDLSGDIAVEDEDLEEGDEYDDSVEVPAGDFSEDEDADD